MVLGFGVGHAEEIVRGSLGERNGCGFGVSGLRTSGGKQILSAQNRDCGLGYTLLFITALLLRASRDQDLSTCGPV